MRLSGRRGKWAGNPLSLEIEDKKGSEDIYFHAEKDFHRVVEHDDDLKVGNDQTIEVKNNRTETVKEGNEKVKEYLALLKTGRTAIKAADPSAVVVLGALTGPSWAKNSTREPSGS